MSHAWFTRRGIIVGLLVVSLFPSVAYAADPLVGKRVVVIKDQAPLAASGKEIAKAAECMVFTVTKVDGDWLWIASEKAYLRRGDVVPFEEAIPHYTRLLETNKTAWNYWKRAQIWRLKGELDIALGDMNDAIRLNPNEPAWFNNRGLLFDGKKDYDKAIADYSEAIRLNSKNGTAWQNRGRAWGNKREFDKAILDFNESLKLIDPNEKRQFVQDAELAGGDSIVIQNSRAETLNQRGWVWNLNGNYDKALVDYEEAIRLAPKFMDPFNGIAWLRATCPEEKYRNGQQAVEYATKVCELTAWKDANYLDTLSAAHAEAGGFDKAVEWQQKAMDLAPANEKADYESRLKLYQEQKPYRQPPAK